MSEVSYNIDELMRILPHRYPFLLLDRVLSVEEGSDSKNRVGRKIIALKNVTINEPYFPGHFPHRPVMPGVLQLEAMAQAGAIAAYNPTEDPQDVAIVGVNSARFRKPVLPGDTLKIHAEINRDRGSMVGLQGAIYVEDVKVAEAEILAKVFPLEKA